MYFKIDLEESEKHDADTLETVLKASQGTRTKILVKNVAISRLLEALINYFRFSRSSGQSTTGPEKHIPKPQGSQLKAQGPKNPK